MNLTDLTTAIQKTSALTGRYAALREIFMGFHAQIESQLQAAQYEHWNIQVSELTELNDFAIFIAGREIIFNFDIETGNAGSHLGLITAFVADDHFDGLPNVIASFSFDGGGIARDLGGLEDLISLKVDLHCLNIALDICLKAFEEIEE